MYDTYKYGSETVVLFLTHIFYNCEILEE